MRTMAIDYVRQVIEQTLEQEHSKYPTKYFGGKNQVNLMSFYEQLQEEYEVNRFTEVYRDLVNEQNRSGLIMNGTIVAPENPQIMNINSATIIPLTFTTSFRVALKDRDEAIETITHMMDILRGRKRDVAEFDNGSLFMVGTIANDVLGTPTVKSGDYIGSFSSGNPSTQQFKDRLTEYENLGADVELKTNAYYYFSYNNKLKTAKQEYDKIQISVSLGHVTYGQIVDGKRTASGYLVFESLADNYTEIPNWLKTASFLCEFVGLDGEENEAYHDEIATINANTLDITNGTIGGTASFSVQFKEEDEIDLSTLSISIGNHINPENIDISVVVNDKEDGVILAPKNESFAKNKVSISFDSIRIDEPKTLNAEEYCTISFGGSATVVSENVALGNDLTKLGIKKYKVKAQTDVSITDSYHWLEPLEMPSGLGISGEISQLASHNFIQNKHNDGINPTFNYSFVLTKDEQLIYQWWKYARYGTLGTYNAITPYSDGVTPNMLYSIEEIWSSWGQVEVFSFYAKTTDNVDIENTESDALSIKLTFELQKE